MSAKISNFENYVRNVLRHTKVSDPNNNPNQQQELYAESTADLAKMVEPEGSDVNPLTEEDYKTAFKFFSECDSDDQYVAFMLAQMYSEGKGVEKDLFKAATYYEKAAAKGNLFAKVALAKMHFMNEGGLHDIQTGIELLTECVEKNDLSAIEILATEYLDGGMVKQDIEKGIAILEKGFALEDALSAFRLGNIYQLGQGVPVDLTKAIKYYLFAAEKGDTNAMCNLGIIYFSAEDFIDFAQAKKWLYRGAVLGNPACMHGLGIYYMADIVGLHQYEEALTWFKKAAECGHNVSLPEIARTYREMGDHKNAIIWLKKSADLGDPRGLYGLGLCYYYGDGVDFNTKKGISYIRQAAAKGDYMAHKFLHDHHFSS